MKAPASIWGWLMGIGILAALIAIALLFPFTCLECRGSGKVPSKSFTIFSGGTTHPVTLGCPTCGQRKRSTIAAWARHRLFGEDL